MTTTARPQDTGAIRTTTAALTVPIQIIRDAGARHRTARAEGAFTLPAWALLAAAALFFAGIALAVLAWTPGASPLLIACSCVGLAAAFTPDVLAALPQRDAD